MASIEPLRSRSNPLVKRFRAVRAGKVEGRVLLEGERLIEDAIASGYELEAVLVDAKLAPPIDPDPHGTHRLATRDVIGACSDLSSPPNAIAIGVAPPIEGVERLPVGGSSLLLVLADVADPGNLGACARVAEAGGATAVGLAGSGASPRNPKALRGSMGSLLRLPLVAVRDAAQLAELGWRSVRAATRGGTDFRRHDWTGPTALWLTGETGRADVSGPVEDVSIPMAGNAESLNVAVAAALLVFAAGRVSGEPRE
ncbi:MAG: TrmH family RNA methyltransferase [Planctomycetota bacterium]